MAGLSERNGSGYVSRTRRLAIGPGLKTDEADTLFTRTQFCNLSPLPSFQAASRSTDPERPALLQHLAPCIWAERQGAGRPIIVRRARFDMIDTGDLAIATLYPSLTRCLSILALRHGSGAHRSSRCCPAGLTTWKRSAAIPRVGVRDRLTSIREAHQVRPSGDRDGARGKPIAVIPRSARRAPASLEARIGGSLPPGVTSAPPREAWFEIAADLLPVERRRPRLAAACGARAQDPAGGNTSSFPNQRRYTRSTNSRKRSWSGSRLSSRRPRQDLLELL